MSPKTETLLGAIKILRFALEEFTLYVPSPFNGESLAEVNPKYREEAEIVGTALRGLLLTYLRENVPTLAAYKADSLTSSLNNLEFEFLEIGGESEGEDYRAWWLSRPDAP